MSDRATAYFYVLTVQLANPAGGTGRILSSSGVFYDHEDLTQSVKLGQSLKALCSEWNIWLLKGQSNDPNFSKFSILHYQCTHELGPVGEISVDTLKRTMNQESEI